MEKAKPNGLPWTRTGLILALATLAAVLACIPLESPQDAFDPYLHQKAYDYQDFLVQWHSTGLGGVSDILFTDETRQEMSRTWGSGDSTDWTAMYLVTQSMRYIVTGEEAAREEVLRIAHYLHIVKAITGDPGYLARYAAPDEPPWNVEYPGADNRYYGEGEYEGLFWLGKNSRDKYISWFWGLTWAYDAVDDPEMRDTIRRDFADVIGTLLSRDWTIIDPYGETHAAAKILPGTRFSLLLQAAHVIGEPEYWARLDEEFEASRIRVLFTTFSGFNKYMEYFAFINNYSAWQPIFRLWPDPERLAYLFRVWRFDVRRWSEGTHNAFFDATYYGACVRLGTCDPLELEWIAEDVRQGLTDMNDPPNYQRATTCPELPLDPFSVWADTFLGERPFLESLIDIDPQTAEAHAVKDRCWDSVLWERSPYHTECRQGENPAHTAHGVDYLIGYWMGVYYGLLPGGGPYGQ